MFPSSLTHSLTAWSQWIFTYCCGAEREKTQPWGSDSVSVVSGWSNSKASPTFALQLLQAAKEFYRRQHHCQPPMSSHQPPSTIKQSSTPGALAKILVSTPPGSSHSSTPIAVLQQRERLMKGFMGDWMHSWNLLLLSYFPMAVIRQGLGPLWYNLNKHKEKVGQGTPVENTVLIKHV